MAKRITIYVPDDVLNDFDGVIGIVKRSTAITKLMKNEVENGGGLVV